MPSPTLEFVCELPDRIPAQAVATSVAVGPDGAYYVGELKGFPGSEESLAHLAHRAGDPTRASAAPSPACTVVAGVASRRSST